MLPERIFYSKELGRDTKNFHRAKTFIAITDWEWLQIVQWVEEKLTDEELFIYEIKLKKIYKSSQGKGYFSQWLITCKVEQRCAALEAAGVF